MNKYLCYAAIPALLAAPALAGNLQEPAVEPIVAPPAQTVSNWSGFYMGGQLGFGRTSSITVPQDLGKAVFPTGNPEANFGKLDGGLGGIHGGYLHNFDHMVVGGEFDYDWADLSGKHTDMSGDTAKLEVKNIARLKALLGYDIGDGLLYGTAGAFRAEMKGTTPFGDTGTSTDNGWVVGAGYKHKFTDDWIGGVEVLYHEATNFDKQGFDLKVTTATARVSYKF